MNKVIIFVLGLILGFVACHQANAGDGLEGVTELYKIDNRFRDGILMFKDGPTDTKMTAVSLEGAELIILKYGPPRNCLGIYFYIGEEQHVNMGCFKSQDVDELRSQIKRTESIK